VYVYITNQIGTCVSVDQSINNQLLQTMVSGGRQAFPEASQSKPNKLKLKAGRGEGKGREMRQHGWYVC
jgi:hypothetical protein